MKTFNSVENSCLDINDCLNQICDAMKFHSSAIELLNLEEKFSVLLETMHSIHDDVQDEMLRQEQGVN